MTARRAVLFALLLAACAGAWGQSLTITPAALPTTLFPVNQPIPTQQFHIAAPFQNDPIQWSESGNFPPGLNFDPVKGGITGTPTQAGIFIFTVAAVDVSTDLTGSRQYSLYISLGPLTLTPLTPPSAAAGTSYTATPFQVGGGVPGYSWALQSGSNSDGLTINTSNGQLSGIPSSGGVFNITVVAFDSSGSQVTGNFNLNVLGVSTTSLPAVSVGTAYSQTLAAAGSTGTLTWSVPGTNLPPPGLTLSSQGQITGTPTASGTFPFVVQVTDSASRLSATQGLSITVAPPAAITPSTLPGGTVNVPYTTTTLTVPNVTISNWAVTVGTLPAGLNLNASTGALSGTPTAAGSSTFTISATPAAAVAVLPPVVQAFTVVIGAAPSVTITGLPSVGAAATQSTATVSLSGAYPFTVSGTMTLTFTPTSGAAQTYDAKFANGSGTTTTFTITPPATSANVPVMIGSVAGTITITTTNVHDSNGGQLAPPAPIVITVNPTGPVILSVVPCAVTLTGFNVSVTGYSTPRDMSSALFHFVFPTATSTTSADIPVALTTAFTNWYNSAASNQFGSQFKMTAQFSFTGPPGTTVPFTAMTAALTNSKGTSNPTPGQTPVATCP